MIYMTFDKVKYEQSKNKVIELIKQRLPNWESTEGFILDGVICPDIYENEKLKILVILAESYGYDKEKITNIEDQPDDDLLGVKNPKVQSPRKIGTLLWLLFNSLEQGKIIPLDELPNLFTINDDNYGKLQNEISKIAYLNVKKASKNVGLSRDTRMDEVEIYNCCKINKEILQLQIDSICPDLIIAFSDPVINGLIDNSILETNVQRKKYLMQSNSMGQKIMFMRHPSYFRDWTYDEIYETYLILYASLKSE